ncbi:MAG: hypothetical protein ACETWQ_04830 [Phycisphaerae bacterium]
MRNVKYSRFPLGRTTATWKAVFFLGLVGVFFFLCLLYRANLYYRMRFGRVMALSVDFSTPGDYIASIKYRPAVKDAILGLDVPKKILSEMSADELHSGLQCTYTIRDKDGKKLFSGSLVQEPIRPGPHPYENVIQLAYLGDWYGEVKWQINATITQGAPALKGIPHRLVLIDDEVRLEFTFPLFLLYWFIAPPVLLVAAITLIALVAASLRKRKRLSNSQQITDTNCVERGR